MGGTRPRSAPVPDPDAVHSTAYRRLFLFFIVVFLATMWPVYPVFNRIQPFVFGIPFSLFYVFGLTVVSFTVLLVFHIRVGSSDD